MIDVTSFNNIINLLINIFIDYNSIYKTNTNH